MRQKFLRGERVHVKDSYREFDAIIDHSYADAYGGSNITDFCVVILDVNDKPCNKLAWIHERDITSVSKDYTKGMEAIEYYNFELSPQARGLLS